MQVEVLNYWGESIRFIEMSEVPRVGEYLQLGKDPIKYRWKVHKIHWKQSSNSSTFYPMIYLEPKVNLELGLNKAKSEGKKLLQKAFKSVYPLMDIPKKQEELIKL
jgi:hypothetical protein